MSDPLRDVEREIRNWAARPPAASPRVARTRVLARIGKRRKPAGWRLAVAAGVLAAGLVAGLLVLGPKEPADTPAVASAKAPAPRILIYELRSGTRLYLALAAATVKAPMPDGTGDATRKGDGQ